MVPGAGRVPFAKYAWMTDEVQMEDADVEVC